MAKLTGPQIGELQQALLPLFTQPEFESLLLIQLDRRLDLIVPRIDAFPQVVRCVIESAEAKGWTADLLDAVHAERPKNTPLQDLIDRLHARLEAPEADHPFHDHEAKNGSDAFADSGDSGQRHRIEAQVGRVGPGAQVAIGVNIQQKSVAVPSLSAVDRAAISDVIEDLRRQLTNMDLPESKKAAGLEFIGELEQELIWTAEAPDSSVIKVAGDWLLRNASALAPSLKAIFLSPVVNRVVEAAGDPAATWVEQSFGPPRSTAG